MTPNTRPRRLPTDCYAAADVVLTEDRVAAPPFVCPQDGVQAGVDSIAAALAANPVAATSLALLLRSSSGLSVPARLVAASATYSALQEGAETGVAIGSRHPVPVPVPGCLQRVNPEHHIPGRDHRELGARVPADQL
jgi:hypothetical protein